MNRFTWKGIADLASAGAIVGSLVFVGLQMRQTQKIAIADSYSVFMSSQIALLELVNANAEVWAKATSGGELNAAETVIFENLVIAWNDSNFYSFQSDLALLPDDWPWEEYLADFSGFLFDHPRAREVWNARELRLTEYRDLLRPPEHVSTRYADAVRANLAKLDEAAR